jgi:hypothetical protein
MNFNYKLPRVQDLDGLSVLTTPAATDAVLASGVLTVLDESGNNAIVIKASDLLGFRYDAYTTGTASVVEVDLSAATLVDDNIYSLTVSAPYVQNFFGGGQETKAVYIPRTYTVSVGVSPTTQDLLDAFLAAINSDPAAYFSAADLGGSVLEITADSALAGPLFVETGTPGAVITIATVWVAPVGTPTEVARYTNDATLIAGTYDRYIIQYRRIIRHNAVSGLGVIKNATALVYADSATAAAFIAELTPILDGSYTPVADYLGCPAV